MKKYIYIAFLCITVSLSEAATGQTTAPNKFSQYVSQQNYPAAIAEGIRLSQINSQNGQWAEAFTVCRTMNAILDQAEQNGQSRDYLLRYQISKERLRLYTRISKKPNCEDLIKELKATAEKINTDSIKEDLLRTEAEVYMHFNETAKSLECFHQIINLKTAGKTEKDVRLCFENMLKEARQDNQTLLASELDKMYGRWQDSIKAVKTASEISRIQNEYAQVQETLKEKESTLSTRLIIIWVISIIALCLTAALAFVGLLLLKAMRNSKKLKQSLTIANENNIQKSSFIQNMGKQLSPAINTIAEESKRMAGADKLQATAQGICNLIDDMEAYFELENTREEHYPTKNIQAAVFCNAVMEKAKAYIKTGIETKVEAPNVQIKGNAEALEKVLLHLLYNAAMHTESGKISLEFRKRGARTLQFLVTDTGCGIPAEQQEQLMQPFTRIADLTEGSGLGLPTCNLIAYKMNGTLTLDTSYKKGARFILEVHV